MSNETKAHIGATLLILTMLVGFLVPLPNGRALLIGTVVAIATCFTVWMLMIVYIIVEETLENFLDWLDKKKKK